MRLEALFRRQNPCAVNPISCPAPPTCDVLQCNMRIENCIYVASTCTHCGRSYCQPKVSSTGLDGSSKTTVSSGALAGGIIGAILFLVLVLGLFLWHRRRSRLIKLSLGSEVKDTPAAAVDVLNRPDPTEKPRPPSYSYATNSSSYTYTDSSPSLPSPNALFRNDNPFDDANSIQTSTSEGTNVIPIALVTPDSHMEIRTQSSDGSSGPVRPSRSPDLNLDHDDNRLRVENGNGYAESTISGFSAVSNSRYSYMSNMTSATELLNEAPMIMTPAKGKVMGLMKAEVIKAGPHGDGLKPPSFTRAVNKSPLASTSFGPGDTVKEENPFDDRPYSTNADYAISPPPSASSFNTRAEDGTAFLPNGVNVWARDDGLSRPSSIATQAGSVIDIASAKIVNVGLVTPGTANTNKSYRTTMGRIISPSTAGSSGTLEEQQALAIAHAHAQAKAQGAGKSRPVSSASALSATADSILESFPFVPPSPISNLPLRSPPVSPLGQQTFSTGTSSPLGQHAFVVAPPSPMSNDQFDDGALPPPPNRRILGLSTGSQLSTVSTGLGSFPFQIDSGAEDTPMPPASRRLQRASLDTLALTADLSSYPLGFDTERRPNKARK
ncbi:hypothetical protein FA15DRAFT_753151 [Coprinopsis marcescibilis]|uniref:Membrane anchor Opy2 N-terminal domain-containing protein n=1 Tax=Coprinopsis marcescibilis TaxID=230819 RepID=A0A5C3L6Y1_COPMA|nr:hypothetical protein FA15DRAFT_753151 [Coprinopsis marcescibilis]